jgi:amino acid transporter
MNRVFTVLKRFFVGEPVSTHAELHHRLPKRIALAVFSSDALSSSAYATDEIFLALALGGGAALSFSLPVAIAVAVMLIIVINSYRQTVRAYPQGGGAYRVAHDNLGPFSGLIAASSLLVDYVLTVAVSVAAGVQALIAAFPDLENRRLLIAVSVVALICLANMRGLKESGTLFAIPTYGFLISVGIMIVIGLFRVVSGNYEPMPPPEVEASRSLSFFLVIFAFAKGSTALTGVEAISDGVPAFKPPEAKNAAFTLGTLGVLLASLFLGITFLANAYRANPHLIETESKTIPSQIAAGVFGANTPMFYVVQVFTALILVLAANTAYADFPRLLSFLARDRYVPRVFQNRGDRLAFSNGILILSVAAATVVIVYRANLHNIILLYVIGVFTSFTLSQSGMVRRWFRLKSTGWKRSALFNGIGAFTTGVVLVIQAVTRFAGQPEKKWDGAWQVMVLIPLLAMLLWRVRVHYSRVSRALTPELSVQRIASNRAIVLASPYLGASVKALAFALAFNPEEIHFVSLRMQTSELEALRRGWDGLGIRVPIEKIGNSLDDLETYVRSFKPTPSNPVTLVLPDPQFSSPLAQILRGRTLLRLKGRILNEPSVVVASVPFRPDIEPPPERLRAPSRMSLIVVVSSVNRALMRAIEYAKSLHPADLKAVTVSLESAESSELLRNWQEARLDIPLEIVDSPYRSVIQPLLQEIRDLSPNPNDAVGVIVPEFILEHWWEHLLHGQTALLIKSRLLFEPNVVVIDVPYPIGGDEGREEPEVEERETARA